MRKLEEPIDDFLKSELPNDHQVKCREILAHFDEFDYKIIQLGTLLFSKSFSYSQKDHTIIDRRFNGNILASTANTVLSKRQKITTDLLNSFSNAMQSSEQQNALLNMEHELRDLYEHFNTFSSNLSLIAELLSDLEVSQSITELSQHINSVRDLIYSNLKNKKNISSPTKAHVGNFSKKSFIWLFAAIIFFIFITYLVLTVINSENQ